MLHACSLRPPCACTLLTRLHPAPAADPAQRLLLPAAGLHHGCGPAGRAPACLRLDAAAARGGSASGAAVDACRGGYACCAAKPGAVRRPAGKDIAEAACLFVCIARKQHCCCLVAAAHIMPSTASWYALTVPTSQGLRQIGLAAALEALQAAFEAGGLYSVLRGGLLSGMPVLRAVGILKLAGAAAYSAAGLIVVAWLAPGGMLGSSSSGSSGGGMTGMAGCRQGTTAAERDAEAAAPLLAEWRQEEGPAVAQHPAVLGPAHGLWLELRAALHWRHLGSLLRDCGNVSVRAVVVQGSTFLLALAAARLGQSALAAYQIAQQLWVLPSHLIGGLQTAAIVLGGRLAAEVGGPDCEAHRCGALNGCYLRLYLRAVRCSQGPSFGVPLLCLPAMAVDAMLASPVVAGTGGCWRGGC